MTIFPNKTSQEFARQHPPTPMAFSFGMYSRVFFMYHNWVNLTDLACRVLNLVITYKVGNDSLLYGGNSWGFKVIADSYEPK